MKVPTVTINRDGRKVIINKSDLTDEHTLWGQKAKGRQEAYVTAADEYHARQEAEDLPSDKDELIAILGANGITKDRRSSVETLQELVRDL